MTTDIPRPQYLTFAGKRVVVLDEEEYDRLSRRADVWEPVLPASDANGNFPAVATANVLTALAVLRSRRRLGLSQAELARLAGIRLATLDRIERADPADRMPTVRAIDKIDAALKAAAVSRKSRNGR